MTAFALAVDALFDDPNIAVDALWRAGGAGAGTPVRVVRRAPDEVASYRASRLVVDTDELELRTSEVGTLAAGDTIDIDGELFAVIGDPTRDRDRLIWTATVRAP